MFRGRSNWKDGDSMKGYDLSEGKYIKRHISEDELWNTMNWLFSTRSKSDSSYKFIFFKAILDNIDDLVDAYMLEFDRLFERFTEIGWNLVLKYGIRQKALTKGKSETYLEQVLHASCETSSYAAFKDLGEHERKRICKMVKSKCKTYVVGALYGDTNKLMYSFSKKEEWIELNPQLVNFFRENKAVIENLNYYKWARFYESINDEALETQLMNHITDDVKRKNESVYRGVLAYEFERIEYRNEYKQPVNTLELLFMAEEHSSYGSEVIDTNISNVDVETELYEDFDTMRAYLAEPIQLITKLKKERGIL